MTNTARGRDLSRPVTVVNRFTVKGEAEKFQREFLEHAEFLRRQPGFGRYITVRLINHPERYVHLGYWRNLEAFVDVVHHETFLAHVQRLSAMVETGADQVVNVLRRVTEGGRSNRGEPGAMLLTDYVVEDDPAEFERRSIDRFDYLAGQPGCGALELLRSTVRPQRYVELAWWYDARRCDEELRSEKYQGHRERLAGIARSTTQPARHVAYQSTGC